MKQPKPSVWARKRFDGLAAVLMKEIPSALRRAHRRALASHLEMGFKTNEAYGLIWKALHEELIAAIGGFPDVRVTKPKGASYELAVIGEQNVILYPWRYGDDVHSRVSDQRMRLSDVRNNLLALGPQSPESQLMLEHVELSEEELAALFEEARRDWEAMSSAGRTVIVAYASNPNAGILRIYWGDAEKADDDGHLRWTHIEEMPLHPADRSADTGGTPVRSVTRTDSDTGVGRFDHAPLQEPVLEVRPPLISPDTDPTAPQPGTGSNG